MTDWSVIVNPNNRLPYFIANDFDFCGVAVWPPPYASALTAASGIWNFRAHTDFASAIFLNGGTLVQSASKSQHVTTDIAHVGVGYKFD